MTSLITRERVTIPTARGHLDGEISYGDAAIRRACLLMNPHPHMGGSMSNNVVSALAERLAFDGALTVRFDYRGIGRSAGERVNVIASMLQFWETGHAPNDPQLIEDAAAARDWMREQTDAPTVLIGYSFGALAALRALDERVAALVLIAPTLRQHDFSVDTRRLPPTLVIYSDNDFATPRDLSERWLEQVGGVSRLCISGGEHFYRGREDQIVRACNVFLRDLEESEVSCL